MSDRFDLTGPRDAAYQLQIAAEKAEWLRDQVRANGRMPVYGALAILNEQAALLRTLQAAAESAVQTTVARCREVTR